MGDVNIRVDGIDRLGVIAAAMGRDPALPLRRYTRALAEAVKDKLAPYPPSSEANAPVYHLGGSHSKAGNYGRWYERGYGPRWVVKSGAIHGRKTSEMLNRQWGIRQYGTFGALLGNRASYSPYVHHESQGGEDGQAKFHAERGWKTDKWALSQVMNSDTPKRLFKQVAKWLLGWK